MSESALTPKDRAKAIEASSTSRVAPAMFPSRRLYPVLSRRATLKNVAATIVTAPSTIRWIAES
jgi:hypothetical protein